MKVACLSGKGGAGKTLVAVNLITTAEKGTYIDCDVEEPNGRLFLKPENVHTETVDMLLPEFDANKCNGCKKCVEFCRFHALIYIKDKPMVFSEVCHSCGGCALVCSENAITECSKPIGSLEVGNSGNIKVVTGILNPGEASGVPVISKALKQSDDFTVIDCPPGSACSVMESVKDTDFCLLVVEPTSFGFHNFQMVYELVTLLGKKCGVVINKSDAPYIPMEEFCKEKKLPIFARIPYDSHIAALSADGLIATKNDKRFKSIFDELLHKIGGAV